MLKYFFSNLSIPEVIQIAKSIDEIKLAIYRSNFIEDKSKTDKVTEQFSKVKQLAINNNDEELANSTYVAQHYFNLFIYLTNYFNFLSKQKYRESWDVLQNCIDECICIGKYTQMENRKEIPDIIVLLENYERLYPFKIFASSEFIIKSSICSICNKPIQSLSCKHIRGNLYMGEIALEIVNEISELQAIALVENPVNKRLVMNIVNDSRSELEIFSNLNNFLLLDLNLLEIVKFVENSNIDDDENSPIIELDTKSLIDSRNSEAVIGKRQNTKTKHYFIEPIGMVHLEETLL